VHTDMERWTKISGGKGTSYIPPVKRKLKSSKNQEIQNKPLSE
jgi:hypothetical protein